MEDHLLKLQRFIERNRRISQVISQNISLDKSQVSIGKGSALDGEAMGMEASLLVLLSGQWWAQQAGAVALRHVIFNIRK